MQYGAKRFQPGDYRLVCVAMISPKAQLRPSDALRIDRETFELFDVERDEHLGFVVTLSRN